MNKLCNDEKSDDDDDAFRTNDDWGCAESKDDWGMSSKNNATTNHAEEEEESLEQLTKQLDDCLLYTSPSPRDRTRSRMPSSA